MFYLKKIYCRKDIVLNREQSSLLSDNYMVAFDEFLTETEFVRRANSKHGKIWRLKTAFLPTGHFYCTGTLVGHASDSVTGIKALPVQSHCPSDSIQVSSNTLPPSEFTSFSMHLQQVFCPITKDPSRRCALCLRDSHSTHPQCYPTEISI